MVGCRELEEGRVGALGHQFRNRPVEKSFGFILRRNRQMDTMQYPLGAMLWGIACRLPS